jgi:hypothetical protein
MYVQALNWTSWTPTSATALGTLMTNDGVPDCADGTWTAHPGYTVTLGTPKVVTYCTAGSGEASAELFTSVNVWGGGPIPVFQPPC